MPTYRVTAPDGRKIKLTGDSPPTEAELEQIFAGLPEKPPAQAATDSGMAQAMAGAEERAGEHGVGGAVLGAAKELGGAPLKLIDYIPLIAAARKMGILPEGFDAAMAKAHESLRPRGSTEQTGATTAKVVKGAGEVAAGLMSGAPALSLARGAEAAVPATEAVATAAPGVSSVVKSGIQGAAEMLGQKIGEFSGVPGGRWLGGAIARRLAASANAGSKVATEAAPAASKIAAAEASAAQMSRMTAEGAAKATRQTAVTQFAKQVAQSNPKIGEKIWILLDKAGNPVKALTPYQAGAALRAGEETTWVKNLW